MLAFSIDIQLKYYLHTREIWSYEREEIRSFVVKSLYTATKWFSKIIFSIELSFAPNNQQKILPIVNVVTLQRNCKNDKILPLFKYMILKTCLPIFPLYMYVCVLLILEITPSNQSARNTTHTIPMLFATCKKKSICYLQRVRVYYFETGKRNCSWRIIYRRRIISLDAAQSGERNS